MNTFSQQGHFKSVKIDSKPFHIVTKHSISNKCCSFQLSVNQRILNKSIHFKKNLTEPELLNNNVCVN